MARLEGRPSVSVVEVAISDELLAYLFCNAGVVLGAAAHFGVQTVVTSASEIYGYNTSDLVREDDDRVLGSPLKSRWSYSEAKAIEEALAYTLWASQGLSTVIARLFNTVGPRQTGQYGMVVPRFVSAALAQEPVTLYGTGEQSRVLCHVLDAVRGVLALWDEPKAHGDVFNIGGTEEISIRSLAERVIEHTGSTSSIVQVPYDQAYEPGFEDMQRRAPAIDKIHALTGWAPQLSLDVIIRDVVEHQLATGTN